MMHTEPGEKTPKPIDEAEEGYEFGLILKGVEGMIQKGDIIRTYENIKKKDQESKGLVFPSNENIRIAIVGYSIASESEYEKMLSEFFPNAKINFYLSQDQNKIDISPIKDYNIVFVGAVANNNIDTKNENIVTSLEKSNKRVIKVEQNNTLQVLSVGKIKRRIIID